MLPAAAKKTWTADRALTTDDASLRRRSGPGRRQEGPGPRSPAFHRYRLQEGSLVRMTEDWAGSEVDGGFSDRMHQRHR
jgi:hypothetical protein